MKSIFHLYLKEFNKTFSERRDFIVSRLIKSNSYAPTKGTAYKKQIYEMLISLIKETIEKVIPVIDSSKSIWDIFNIKQEKIFLEMLFAHATKILCEILRNDTGLENLKDNLILECNDLKAINESKLKMKIKKRNERIFKGFLCYVVRLLEILFFYVMLN